MSTGPAQLSYCRNASLHSFTEPGSPNISVRMLSLLVGLIAYYVWLSVFAGTWQNIKVMLEWPKPLDLTLSHFITPSMYTTKQNTREILFLSQCVTPFTHFSFHYPSAHWFHFLTCFCTLLSLFSLILHIFSEIYVYCTVYAPNSVS